MTVPQSLLRHLRSRLCASFLGLGYDSSLYSSKLAILLLLIFLVLYMFIIGWGFLQFNCKDNVRLASGSLQLCAVLFILQYMF